jgi:hypothetical protein
MATTRKIKEAKDLSSGELIYFKGHAKATYMSDGRTVEEAITAYTGGSGGISTGSAAYPKITVLSSDIIYQISPNTFYLMGGEGSIETLSITLGDEIYGVANEYIFQFISGSEPTTLILPDSIKFNSDFIVEANKIYQISILNGLGTVMAWDI